MIGYGYRVVDRGADGVDFEVQVPEHNVRVHMSPGAGALGTCSCADVDCEVLRGTLADASSFVDAASDVPNRRHRSWASFPRGRQEPEEADG